MRVECWCIDDNAPRRIRQVLHISTPLPLQHAFMKAAIFVYVLKLKWMIKESIKSVPNLGMFHPPPHQTQTGLSRRRRSQSHRFKPNLSPGIICYGEGRKLFLLLLSLRRLCEWVGDERLSLSRQKLQHTINTVISDNKNRLCSMTCDFNKILFAKLKNRRPTLNRHKQDPTPKRICAAKYCIL